ncbi:MAG: 3-isopropylmalate dehydratase large subunit [Bacteroidia bacterium]|nr:3-isopropylmalate dehydratase large subunit [Bacteroidia bacterium]
MTIIEKILSKHSKYGIVKPNENIDIFIDTRAARDFGGANVVKNLKDNGLDVADPKKTYFTFDCNPTGSDQKYAVNQHICRLYAREKDITIYDINAGIGTHLAIDSGLAWPGSTFVSTDSHANIMGAICAFGQGMGDQDIAATFAKGAVWFKVPKSVRLNFTGKRPANVTAKDIVLNLLHIFGANKLLGFSVELHGEEMNILTLDERITIASMGTEMGVIILLFPPNKLIAKYCEEKTGKSIELINADPDAQYEQVHEIDISKFVPMVSMPGKPHDSVPVSEVKKTKIDSAFIGSCTNGRMEDLRAAAAILKGRKAAPGVLLKIVPATDDIWKQCLSEGLIEIFKQAGALFSNAGCAGCAAGQVGMNGKKEVTVSTGNRNFPGKQGDGDMYLASPDTVAASAIAGYITTSDDIPEKPALFETGKSSGTAATGVSKKTKEPKPTEVEGRVWFIKEDNIDTDMIFHNRYLTITDISQMGQYALDNLKGYENFAKKAKKGDIIVTQKNFGAGSSRQQAVDCFIALGIGCIIAESFGAIYERNAINAAMPIMTYKNIATMELKDGDNIRVNFVNGTIKNLSNNKSASIDKFSDVQFEIFQNGGLL